MPKIKKLIVVTFYPLRCHN